MFAILDCFFRLQGKEVSDLDMLFALKNIISCSVSFLLLITACTKNEAEVIDSPEPLPSETDSLPELPAGWENVSLKSFGNIYDINFIGDKGYCVTKDTIFSSTDGGRKWDPLLSGDQFFLLVALGSSETILVVSRGKKMLDQSFIYFSKNAGASFDSVLVDEYISGISSVNADTAFMIGKSLWKTENGGISWKKVYAFPGKHVDHPTLKFINDRIGYVWKHDGLFATRDGGISWVRFAVNGSKPVSLLGSIFMLNDSTGFVTGENHVAKIMHSDTSINFVYKFPQINTGYPYSELHFLSADTGYIATGSHLLKTTDGGNNWSYGLYTHGLPLLTLHFSDADHGWAAGYFGRIYKYVKP